MTGKINTSLAKSFEDQIEFQKKIIIMQNGADAEMPTIPVDNPILFQYHMTAMVEELGEVLKADKRWKTHRNTDFDPDNKMDEIADCFITLFNITMFSGITYDEIVARVDSKIKRNALKLIDRE